MKTKSRLHQTLPALLIAVLSIVAIAPAHAQDQVKVTADKYVRAETDVQIKGYVETMDCFGKFNHNRKHYSVDNQVTVRGSRDFIYSFGAFDLNSPLTITLPETDGRFQSIVLISQDHSIPPAQYAPKKITITKEEVGTRYVFIGIRTFADPNDPEDMKVATGLQDAIKVEQADIGTLELPNWDKQGVVTLREAINVLTATLENTAGWFGEKDKIDPIYHLFGTAFGWGGNPKEDAVYVNFVPEKNDGETAYTLTVKDVPVDAFWSAIVYNKESFFVKNDRDIYSYNSNTAKRNEDGSITIHFGGDPKADNYLEIMDGWNYLVRLYRPREEVLDGTYVFPSPVMAK